MWSLPKQSFNCRVFSPIARQFFLSLFFSLSFPSLLLSFFLSFFLLSSSSLLLSFFPSPPPSLPFLLAFLPKSACNFIFTSPKNHRFLKLAKPLKTTKSSCLIIQDTDVPKSLATHHTKSSVLMVEQRHLPGPRTSCLYFSLYYAALQTFKLLALQLLDEKYL